MFIKKGRHEDIKQLAMSPGWELARPGLRKSQRLNSLKNLLLSTY